MEIKNRAEIVKKLDLKKYERQGVDIGLLFSTLSKTPTERAEDNRALLGFIKEARKSRIKSSNGNTGSQKIS